MGHVFSVELPIGFDPSTFDVLDFEPDFEPEADGVDWLEDDPALPEGTASLYVHRRSTTVIELHLGEEFEVWVPSLTSPAGWGIAFAVLHRATEHFDTVFVTWNDGDLWDLPGLAAHCDEHWRREQFDTDARDLLRRAEAEGEVVCRGPIRSVHIGSQILTEIASGATTLEDVILRTNYVLGPHLVAESIDDKVAGVTRRLGVFGPGLRTLLPAIDAVLLDTIDARQAPVLVPIDALEQVAGLHVIRLDEVQRLVEAVKDAAWPSVLESAQQFSIS